MSTTETEPPAKIQIPKVNTPGGRSVPKRCRPARTYPQCQRPPSQKTTQAAVEHTTSLILAGRGEGQGRMSVPQIEKAVRFRALHDGPGAFVIPNPWDVGSARILAGLGFQALATSSAASACALGRRDGELTRDEALAHARLIVDATDLPVSADLEKGFGDAPEVVAETIRLAGEVGLVGCTIEDTTGRQDQPLYEFALAVERIAAASEAALALP